ncbi:hypothetical protein CBL_08389 [Carabus blaptoides fortunei]
MKKHENSDEHRSALTTLLARKNADGRVDRSLFLQTEEEIKYWHEVLRRIAAVVIGNYVMGLELLAEFDSFLNLHIKRHGNKESGTTPYLSSKICDKRINLMAEKRIKPNFILMMKDYCVICRLKANTKIDWCASDHAIPRILDQTTTISIYHRYLHIPNNETPDPNLSDPNTSDHDSDDTDEKVSASHTDLHSDERFTNNDEPGNGGFQIAGFNTFFLHLFLILFLFEITRTPIKCSSYTKINHIVVTILSILVLGLYIYYGDTTEMDKGPVFVKEEEILLTSDNWIFTTDISIAEYKQSLDTFEEVLSHIVYIDLELGKSMDSKVKSSVNDVVRERIQNGLVDASGNLLMVLFGTANDYLLTINEKINILTTKSDGLRNVRTSHDY